MGQAVSSIDREKALSALEQARHAGNLSESAVENIRLWLTEPRYTPYAEEVAAHIHSKRWQELDDAFWTIIPFGTGGRRGRMYPIGSNAINERTIGESAQGLAQYVKVQQGHDSPLACAIAFDTRHRSPEFARLCSEVMVANGFTVYLLDEIRSTPELSFMVRYKNCACGIMVTASHNPPSDNAVKVYWSNGGQILPPHDKGVIERVMNADQIRRCDYDQAVSEGKIVACTSEIDSAFFDTLEKQTFAGPREIKIIYSPLHGVGATAVVPMLARDKFTDVEVFADHAEPSGDFPNVPQNLANPENAAVFDSMIVRAKQIGADIVMASDPDCDRLGCAAPVTTDTSGEWKTFDGNQIGVLLADYVLKNWSDAGRLTPDHYIIKTLVTTEMVRRVADSYNVQTFGNLLVGFKWIGGVIDERGPDLFVFGTEESHGYLAGQHARDKDGVIAAMLMAELAAQVKAEGVSLHQRLDSLFLKHGLHVENLMTQQMPGSEGMTRTQALMTKFRSDPPQTIGGLAVKALRDYANNTIITMDGPSRPLSGPLNGPTGDLVVFDLEEDGNYVAARPSGTEPKVKFYMFTYVPADRIVKLQKSKVEMSERLNAMQRDIREFADSV